MNNESHFNEIQDSSPGRESDRSVSDPVLPEPPESKGLFGMSVLSFLVYGSLAWVIIYFYHDRGFAGLFESDYGWGIQLVSGTLLGLIAAGIIIFFAARSPLSSILDDFYIVQIVRKMNLSLFDRTQVSLFAGVGEELLFRGAIQPVIGIWITSIGFVAIHGYFKFTSFAHIIFGLTMFALSMMLGLIFEMVGLIAAMSAHAVYDIVILRWADSD